MPKIKTHRGAAKRFRRTKTGKFKKMSPSRSHLLRRKSRKRKRRLKKAKFAHKSDRSFLQKLLPGS